MTICTIDTEIDGQKTAGRFCNQFDPNNKVIMVQWKYPKKDPEVAYNIKDYKSGLMEGVRLQKVDLSDVTCIVGQNLKFDLIWLMEDLREYLRKGGKVWDIMTVEHILNGQTSQKGVLKLDSLSKKYGLPHKDDRVQEYFDKGLVFSDIPLHIAVDYGKHDVKVTESIFLRQYKRAQTMGMLQLIESHMEHYLAVCELEYNGIYVDQTVLESKRNELIQKKYSLGADIREYISDSWPKEIEFLPSSTKHVSAYLFGGTLYYRDDIPKLNEDGSFIYYKSGKREGQRVTKKEDIPIRVNGILKPSKYPGLELTKKGDYKVGDDWLELFKDNAPDFIGLLQDYRKTVKELGTYIEGYAECISPDGFIHPSFNTALTVTGRLSCSAPNMQNVYPKVKDMFTSQFGDKGVIINFDYSQLEVFIQAWLTQDKQFLDDLLNGVDFHCLRLSYVENKQYEDVVKLCANNEVWQQKRKDTKEVSFAKAYGGGINLIAKNSGLPIETVKKIFDKEDERYPDIKRFNDMMLEEINSNAEPVNLPLRVRDKVKGYSYDHPHRLRIRGSVTSPLGKKYYFDQRAVMTAEGKLFEYWHTPEVANYIVQGTAFDIVAEMVGRVWREYAIHNRDKFRMFCETHDSLTVDCKKEYQEEVVNKIKSILENVKVAIKDRYGIDFDIPLRVDYNIGNNWKEAK